MCVCVLKLYKNIPLCINMRVLPLNKKWCPFVTIGFPMSNFKISRATAITWNTPQQKNID